MSLVATIIAAFGLYIAGGITATVVMGIVAHRLLRRWFQ